MAEWLCISNGSKLHRERHGVVSVSNVTLPLIPESGNAGGGPKRAVGTPCRMR